MDNFTTLNIQTNETTIFTRAFGSGPPILLLHGFPQTHIMWRSVAPILARHFTVVCADLRGYGQSGCPESTLNHEPYSKRTMAKDMIQVMEQLGFTKFSVAGHDRGGRVAYRMALDYPDRIAKLAVLDVLPAETVWQLADDRFALGFWPWSLLAQPAPFPERILETIPEVIIDNALSQWGSSSTTFPQKIRNAYIAALRTSNNAHAICEEYRAAATIDREHDRADLKNKNRIQCPLLALWSKGGALDTWYSKESGPLVLWRDWSTTVEGYALKGGHFFPEESPEETANALLHFFSHGKHK